MYCLETSTGNAIRRWYWEVSVSSEKDRRSWRKRSRRVTQLSFFLFFSLFQGSSPKGGISNPRPGPWWYDEVRRQKRNGELEDEELDNFEHDDETRQRLAVGWRYWRRRGEMKEKRDEIGAEGRDQKGKRVEAYCAKDETHRNNKKKKKKKKKQNKKKISWAKWKSALY